MAVKSLIGTVTAGAGGISEAEFISIPQGGDDLLLEISARSSAASVVDNFGLKINGSVATLSGIRMFGSGGNASSGTTTTAGLLDANTNTANTFGSYSLYIPNYASSVAKSLSMDYAVESNSTSTYYNGLQISSWAGTEAISSLGIIDFQVTDLFLENSTFSLYKLSYS